MNPPESKTESDFFDYQQQPVVGPSTSQWQQLSSRLRGIDENDPLRIPELRIPGAILRRIGHGVMEKLELDPESRPQPAPPKTTSLPERIPPVRPNQQPNPHQYLRRRIGAIALAVSLGAGGIALGWPKLVESLKNHPYDVTNRTPTEEEVCTIRRAGYRALLVVAAEFTDDLGSRRAAASRISRAVSNQDDDRFGICYSQANDYSRVLTDEAVENLPAERLVSWGIFPGRTDR